MAWIPVGRGPAAGYLLSAPSHCWAGGDFGIAEAIGALLVGLALAESGHGHRIQRLATPFRDFFGAFLFFSFGLSIDPLSLGGAFALAAAAAVLTIAGNLAAGITVGIVSKLPPQAGVNVGLTIISRGEFSIVMASLAKAGNLHPFIQPFTALYVIILSILGPILTKESDRLYSVSVRLLGSSKVGKATNPLAAPDPNDVSQHRPNPTQSNPDGDKKEEH